MCNKLTVAVVFGGQSSEHDVSCVSGATIMKALNPEKYEMILIGITKEGRWLLADSIKDVESGAWENSRTQAIISPDAGDGGIIFSEGERVWKKKVDVIFPVLHGMYGEDGTIQGLFELCRIPYVGCGVLASSVSMDKIYTKIVVDTLNIRQARYVSVSHIEMRDVVKCAEKVEAALEYPVFVKPSKAGSSVGVNKAVDRESLIRALEEAIKHDIMCWLKKRLSDGRLNVRFSAAMNRRPPMWAKCFPLKNSIRLMRSTIMQRLKPTCIRYFRRVNSKKSVKMRWIFSELWMALDAPVSISLWKKIQTKLYLMKSIHCLDLLR